MLRIFTIFFRTLFHKNTPLSVKALVGGAALYGLFPFDLIPDILPILGQSDDLFVIVLTLLYFWWKTRDVRNDIKKTV
jgi:uncharacterized membrane protein YkvA (DUF1232 family)